MRSVATKSFLAVFVAAALGIVSVGAFDFGRDLKRLMTQPPIIVINLPAQAVK
jgi:hypothetical protein